MSSQYDYTPLEPVYKTDQAIELDNVVHEQPPPSEPEKKCESATKCQSECKRRSCFAKRGGEELTKRQKVCRCICGTFAILFTLWLVGGTIGITYIAVKAHRCIHPSHMAARVDTLDPATTKRLDLAVVAGKVTVRSCPFAKNITVHSRMYAASEELLNTMVFNIVNSKSTGVFKAAVLAPSFDWHHCQHSFIEVVVPEGAQIDVNIDGIIADVEIEASENALRHVNVATKVARIRAHDLETTGNVTLSADVGYVGVKNVQTQGTLTTRQRVGYLRAKELTASTLDAEVHFGCSCAGNLNVTKARIVGQVAWLNFWNVESRNLTAFVDYGKLSVSPQRDFEGNFSVVSPYGFIDASSSHAVTFNYSKNNEAEIVGFVESVQPRHFDLASVYGHVKFFVAEPSHEKRDKHRHE